MTLPIKITAAQKSIVYMLLFVCGFSSPVFSQQVQDKAFDKMLQKLLSHKVAEVTPVDISNTPEVLFLDAREQKEYDTSYIENAVWIGYNDFDIKRVGAISKDTKIVVYCSVGYRSEKITKKLSKAGYTDVSNLYGGIFEWVNQGNKVYGTAGETDNVHTFNKKWSKWLTKGNKVY